LQDQTEYLDQQVELAEVVQLQVLMHLQQQELVVAVEEHK
tara:strand:+ start:212 stop:331 length:120 start_codon:yes stop_codon:yes gene_type:complete